MDHKAQSLIVSIIVFLGLLLPLRLPDFFWHILLTTALTSSLSLFWILEEKPSILSLKRNWLAIAFLFILVSSFGIFAYTLPHPLFQALVLALMPFFIYNTLQVASRIKRGYTPALIYRNVVVLTSVLVVFFLTSNVLKWLMTTEGASERIFAVLITFLTILVVCKFLFESQGYNNSKLYSLVIAFIISQISWLSSYWLVTYPYSEKDVNIGVPVSAILASIYFYFAWGVSHHRLENSLTRKILWEYILISLIFTSILFLTTEWLPTEAIR